MLCAGIKIGFRNTIKRFNTHAPTERSIRK